MSISASAAYNAARQLQQQQQLLQQQQAIVLNNATNAFPTPAEAAVVSTSASAAGMGSSSSRDSGLISPESCTPTALGRWSLLNHKLPEANAVRSIHIYDFDNTREDIFFLTVSSLSQVHTDKQRWLTFHL